MYKNIMSQFAAMEHVRVDIKASTSIAYYTEDYLPCSRERG